MHEIAVDGSCWVAAQSFFFVEILAAATFRGLPTACATNNSLPCLLAVNVNIKDRRSVFSRVPACLQFVWHELLPMLGGGNMLWLNVKDGTMLSLCAKQLHASTDMLIMGMPTANGWFSWWRHMVQ